MSGSDLDFLARFSFTIQPPDVCKTDNLGSCVKYLILSVPTESKWKRLARPSPTRHLPWRRIAVSSQVDLVIACGGDGTINEVVCGMVGSQVPLLVIPAGTANVLAKEIGLSRDWMKSVELVRTGVIRRISLGRVNQRRFILMAGIGVDAGIIAALNYSLKRKLGEASFWIAGFGQLLRYHFAPFDLVINGKGYSATFAVISKAKNYGGPFQITSQADLFSDQLRHSAYFKAVPGGATFTISGGWLLAGISPYPMFNI